MIRVHPQVTGLLHRGDVHGVRAALQAAIEIEHAVIPPYLYALYTLIPGRNDAAAATLRSIVDEEMLHLALVRDTFMRIEQPEHALGFGSPGPSAADPLTIGQFYRRIRTTLVALGEGRSPASGTTSWARPR